MNFKCYSSEELITLNTLSLYGLVQVINKPTHRCGHTIDWVIVRPDDDIHRKSTVTDSLESDHYCTKSYFNISVSKPSTLYRTVRNIANIDRPSFIAELSSVSEFSFVENANHFCDFLRTVPKHAPPSLRKVVTHSSSPWFESLRDELFIAKRERRQADRKWRNTKLATFKDLYRQAKYKVSILVHTAKCKFYTERISLASSSKELHQIVNTLSNRHPVSQIDIHLRYCQPFTLVLTFPVFSSNTLPTKQRNLELTLLLNMLPRRLLLGQLLQLFLHLKKCHN